MKILWFSHFVPYPPAGGAAQRSFNLLRRIAEKHYVVFVGFDMAGSATAGAAPLDALGKFCASVEIWDLPVRWKSAGWWLQALLSTLSGESLSDRVFYSPDCRKRLTQLLQQHPDALVHMDSIDLARYAPALEAQRKALNHHNCESAMMLRRAEKEGNRVAQWFLRRQAHALQSLEQQLLPAFDVNVSVSAPDSDLLRRQAPAAHIHVVENGTDDAFFSPLPEEEEPNSIVFAGSLNWYPNISGLRIFAREVWPAVKQQVPSVRWYIAGMSPTKEIRELAAKDAQITLIDSPADIRPWIARGAVFICPIYDGGGTRLKLLDAFAMGKSVVSTTIGCEGLAVTPGMHLLVADEPCDLVTKTTLLLRDNEQRARLGAAARKLVTQRYSWSILAHDLERAYLCPRTQRTLDSPSEPCAEECAVAQGQR